MGVDENSACFELHRSNSIAWFNFFLILFPLSLLSKLANKDPLILTNRHKTYFVNTEKEFDKKNMKKTW